MGNESALGFESKRHFQLWLYSVSHAQLLLRSTKGRNADSRVDVLFKGVAALNLPTSFDGLRVREATPGHFDVSGANWQGSIEALAFFAAEDDGEYYDLSPFAASLGEQA
ncbi:hypothetical protein JQN72_00115 [Phycicoccus sp. CSK15P-2]|uniref:hypothetical protein n=1 Tax=Phycicoccus sp. CSK15P-2 TaxID=2807627 RepID=UPI00194FBA53|nr:hypothetical protein [Phycicoccus sp. CSK15P-2]MBM6402650.1 hypothetical protein [Phycicoccus sp. CSK15P-2]